MDPTGTAAAPVTAEKKDVEVKTEPSAAETTTTTTTTTKAPATTGDVPDPDEDDLDDLDEMLDEFSTVKLDSKKPADAAPQKTGEAAATTGSAPEVAPKTDGPVSPEDLTEEDFAKQLQAGMANLLGDLEKSPEMQAEFEAMFKSMAGAAGQAGPSGADADAAAAGAGAGAPDASFQDTIRRTMERMQNSGEQATAAAASGGAGDDFMSELMKQMMSGDLGGAGGEGGEEEFSKMLMGMMEQLTNKEILYEPMKELHDKFPEWLERNKATTPAEDLKRYEEQHKLVNDIVAKFESDKYADSNAADREFIVERMQKMQELGSPPSDLVGDLDTAQEAFAGADEQCNPQ